MPGAGKSTLGKPLADALSFDFVDLDQAIEQQERTSISVIFEKKGEPYFRELEHDILQSQINRKENLVISCGGGTPCFFGSMQLMNAVGLTVFLDPPMDLLVERVLQNSDRPLLANEEPEKKLKRLYEKRLPFYAQAAIRMEAVQPSLEFLLADLTAKLRT